MTHQIRQQFLHVELTGTESEGLAMQRLLPGLYYEKLLPALETAFDHSFPDEMILKIDRLEIDAGTIAIDQFDQEFAAVVRKELVRAIHEKDHYGKAASESHDNGKRSLQTLPENLADVFTWFLKTGRLPWSYRLPADKTLEEEVANALNDWQKGHHAGLFAAIIRDALLSAGAVKRLGSQFSPSFQHTLLRMLSEEIAEIATSILSIAQHESLDPEIQVQFRKSVLESAFSHVSRTSQPTEAGLISELFNAIPASLSSELFLRKIILSGQPFPESQTIEPGAGAMKDSGSDASVDEDGIFINNAGLVLMHPFLPRFFESLEIVNHSGVLRSERALCLLHYLATGQSQAPEYELVLPKILCGLLPDSPVSIEQEITETESDESIVLINAVISHWEALRNTSIDGLRGSFLNRPGKLIRKSDGDWQLQVESRTFDVLLDQLPWGIAMIQLPWMKKVLWVEWR